MSAPATPRGPAINFARAVGMCRLPPILPLVFPHLQPKEQKLPKPNYQFEKRKKDMEKKAKKEEKRLRKLNKGASPSPESTEKPA